MPFTQKGATETLFSYERSHNITPYIPTSQKLTKFIKKISEKDSVTIAINNIDDITNLFGLLGNIEEAQKAKSKDKLNFILSESVKESFYKNFPLNLGFIPNVYFLSDKDIEQEEELKKLQDREKWYNSLENKVEIASQLILTNHQSDITDDEKVKILTLIKKELPDYVRDIEVSAASFDNIAKELAREAEQSENLIDDERSLKDKVVDFYQEFNSAFVKEKLEANFSEFLTLADKKEYPGLHMSASYSWNEEGKLEITIKDIKSGGLGHYAGFKVGDKLTLNSFINQEQPDKLDINALHYIIEKVRKGQLQGLEVERGGETLAIASFQEKIDKIYSADPRTKVGKEVEKIIFGNQTGYDRDTDMESTYDKLEQQIRTDEGGRRIEALEEQVAELQKITSEFVASLPSLGGGLPHPPTPPPGGLPNPPAATELQILKEESSKLNGQIGDNKKLQQQVTQLQTRLEELEGKVTSVAALQAEMSALKESFITQEQFQQLQNQVKAYQGSLQNIVSKEVAKKMQNLTDQLKRDDNQRLQGLSAEYKQQEQAYQKVLRDIRTLSHNQGSLVAQQDDLQSQLNEISEMVNGQLQRIAQQAEARRGWENIVNPTNDSANEVEQQPTISSSENSDDNHRKEMWVNAIEREKDIPIGGTGGSTRPGSANTRSYNERGSMGANAGGGPNSSIVGAAASRPNGGHKGVTRE